MTREARIIKIKDADSGEIMELEECQACCGMGGFEASNDCEVYDDWHDCMECDGDGMVELGYFERDRFVPERDAWTPND